jgi:hypothetical protein
VSAYLISQVEVLDAEAWENYRTRAARVIAQFGGRSQTTNDLCRRHRRAAAVAGHITVRRGSVDT